MRLTSVKYSEWQETPQEWTLETLYLAERNLIVGKNASGKSRALNIILGLARFLAGLAKPQLASVNYDVEFTNNGQKINYNLESKNDQVVSEKFSLDGRLMLDRGSGGQGTIWAEQINGGTEIPFQTPTSELATVARRDNIQHSFLEPLYSWGSSLRHYYFGTALGKDRLAILPEADFRKIDERDPNAVVPLYMQAYNEFKEDFNRALISDMRQLDYDVEELGIKPPVSIRILSGPSGLVGLYVKEKDLPGITDQHSMSQGMFRALSLLIQVNYSKIARKSSCILIDDIGEGLDFDRSCRLIDLLREKTETSNIQLVLSTNDRFVMNRVPLEEWSVLQRHGNHVRVLNHNNSKDLFEEFKFTGLSNFSFFEMDFASGLPPEETRADE
ncbi:MAG: ATP-binding protein [Syntrophobacteraceae bacterium]